MRPSGDSRLRVLLVSMPFAARDRPSLGLSSLKARLTQRDVACDVAYLDLAFVRQLGEEDYDAILDGLPFAALAGEWVFTECLYGLRALSPAAYVEDVLRGEWKLDPDLAEPLLRARSMAPRFIAESLGAVSWPSYSLVGFTSCGPQNIASLALARRVKEAHPVTPIVFGGSNWEGVMGRELHRRFPFVDYACSGEADHSLPALAERLRRADAEAIDIPGVVFRDRGTTCIAGEATPVEDLDAMPIPDHSDYFATLAAAAETPRIPPVVPLEASRGCWWGFCD